MNFWVIVRMWLERNGYQVIVAAVFLLVAALVALMLLPGCAYYGAGKTAAIAALKSMSEDYCQTTKAVERQLIRQRIDEASYPHQWRIVCPTAEDAQGVSSE